LQKIVPEAIYFKEKKAKLKDTDRKIEEFIRKYPEAFQTGRPLGKLSVYFLYEKRRFATEVIALKTKLSSRSRK